MITLLIFLAVLSVLVFVHEFGHFICAKRAKLRVDEFGFGFPPRVFGIRRRTTPNPSSPRRGNDDSSSPARGEEGSLLSREEGRRGGSYEIVWGNPKEFDIREGGTVYSLNLLPMGGFVKIKGESGEEQNGADSFASRGALTRIIIIAAGVIMNFLLAALLFAGGFMIGVPQPIELGVSRYARVSDQRIEVLNVLPDSPAAGAGLHPGDRLIAGNGKEFGGAEEFRLFVTEFLEKPVHLKVMRGTDMLELTATPQVLVQTNKPGIGIGLADIGVVRYPIWLAIPKGFELAAVLMKTIVVSVGGLIRDALVGRPVTADLAGPVGIAVLTGQAARQGILSLLQFMAILSLNLAFLNIIPFPALDGGRILFIVLEKILRRPVSRKIEGWVHGAGFVLLILLVLFVTYQDLGRYGGRIVEFLRKLI